ncbi:MAG: M20/M25/M40 family metallo-hydrolase [Pirellulales bacterium]|nr:M20/M25/M40 family metallo-hydrolase [Pirellulales bacterium]
MAHLVREILGQLIARPSVNPRLVPAGDPSTDDISGEKQVTEWLIDFLGRQGWPWLTQEVHPGRSNVVAVVPGGRSDCLLWEAHQDTVAVAGMNAPFIARESQGLIYGRGACDVKGGLAAMLAALVAAGDAPLARRPTIVFASTVNEECGFTGVRALARFWDERSGELAATTIQGPLSLAELRRFKPRAAIVAEPTDLNVVAAHRGVVRWQARTAGRAAHSSRPAGGANAIYAMARVVQALEAMHDKLGRGFNATATGLAGECGPPTICVTTIQGGAGPNTVPDAAVIDLDRRLAPGESPETAYAGVVAELERAVDLGPCRLTHDPPWMQSYGLAGGESQRWAERLAAIVDACGVASRIVGVPYGTNAATLAAAGIPAAVFGPGSIEQAHTIDEFIAVDQLDRAVEVLVAIATGAAATPDH